MRTPIIGLASYIPACELAAYILGHLGFEFPGSLPRRTSVRGQLPMFCLLSWSSMLSSRFRLLPRSSLSSSARLTPEAGALRTAGGAARPAGGLLLVVDGFSTI